MLFFLLVVALPLASGGDVFVVQAEMRMISKPTSKSEATKSTLPQAGCTHRLGSKR